MRRAAAGALRAIIASCGGCSRPVTPGVSYVDVPTTMAELLTPCRAGKDGIRNEGGTHTKSEPADAGANDGGLSGLPTPNGHRRHHHHH